MPKPKREDEVDLITREYVESLEKQLQNAKTLIMRLSIALDSHHTDNNEYELIQEAESFIYKE